MWSNVDNNSTRVQGVFILWKLKRGSIFHCHDESLIKPGSQLNHTDE
jgi:hypothetical protein